MRRSACFDRPEMSGVLRRCYASKNGTSGWAHRDPASPLIQAGRLLSAGCRRHRRIQLLPRRGEGSPALKWLNYVALCDHLLRGSQVIEVNYFTARVINRPTDPSQSQRQDDYLRALQANPRLKVVLGQFQRKKASVEASKQNVRLADGSTGALAAGQLVRGRAWEEKGSDVNLAPSSRGMRARGTWT